jgi:hypothetical protein
MCALLDRLILDLTLALCRALTIGTGTWAGYWLTLIPAGVFGAFVVKWGYWVFLLCTSSIQSCVSRRSTAGSTAEKS